MSEVIFGPDGETIIPFEDIKSKVNADLAALALTEAQERANKKKRNRSSAATYDPFPPLPEEPSAANDTVQDRILDAAFRSRSDLRE